MFYGLGQMNKNLWILYVTVPTSLLTLWSSITSSIIRRAKLISIWHVVDAHPTSCHFFAWVLCAICFCTSKFCHLCSSHDCLSSSSTHLCFAWVGLYWSSLGPFMSFLTSFYFWFAIMLHNKQLQTCHKHNLLNYCKKKVGKENSPRLQHQVVARNTKTKYKNQNQIRNQNWNSPLK